MLLFACLFLVMLFLSVTVKHLCVSKKRNIKPKYDDDYDNCRDGDDNTDYIII